MRKRAPPVPRCHYVQQATWERLPRCSGSQGRRVTTTIRRWRRQARYSSDPGIALPGFHLSELLLEHYQDERYGILGPRNRSGPPMRHFGPNLPTYKVISWTAITERGPSRAMHPLPGYWGPGHGRQGLHRVLQSPGVSQGAEDLTPSELLISRV